MNKGAIDYLYGWGERDVYAVQPTP
jgi:hypothetical protein